MWGLKPRFSVYLAIITSPNLYVASYTLLKQIRVSNSIWDADFSPNKFVYHIRIPSKVVSATVECGIDFSRYANADQWPLVKFNKTMIEYSRDHLASRTFDLSATPYRQAFLLVVAVSSQTPAVKDESRYSLYITKMPDYERLLLPVHLSVSGLPHGEVLQLQPTFIAAIPELSYDVKIPPQMQKATISVNCDRLATLEVDSVAVESPVQVALNTAEPRVQTRIACVFEGHRRSFTLNFLQRVPLDEISFKLHVLGDRGLVEKQGDSHILVLAKSPQVELVPMYNDPRVELDLLDPSGSSYRLGIGIPSPALVVPKSADRKILLQLHSHGDMRQITVTLRRWIPPALPPPPTPGTPPVVQLGFLIVFLVCLSLLVVSITMGGSEALGFGAPNRSSLALRTLLLLVQFVAFSCCALRKVFHGVDPLLDLASSLQWMTLFPVADLLHGGALDAWPPMRRDCYAWLNVGTTQAKSGLGAALAIFGLVVVLHLLTIAWLLLGGWSSCKYTLPHGLRFGAWEVRCLILLAYPATCAAVLILLDTREIMMPWRCAAIMLLTVLLCSALALELGVQHALNRRLVTWVFEDGHSGGVEDEDQCEDGYFCDATCDQLSTRPVERSCCAPFLSHRWGTTVADLRSVDLQQTLTERQASARTAKLIAETLRSQDVTAQGDSTTEVEVVATLRPGTLRQPFASEVGWVCNIPWLLAKLTAPALLQLHHEVDVQLHDWATPVQVHVDQLQGPITGGWLSLCFGGLHWPHLPPLELLLRCFLGAASAIGMSATPTWNGAWPTALLLSAALAGGLFMFIFFHTPCTSLLENNLLLLAYLGITLISLELLAHSLGVFGIQECSWSILASFSIVGAPLLVYVVLVACTLFCAITCPVGQVEKVESHKSCNADLILRGPQDSWMLLMPAISNIPVSDAFVHPRIAKGKDSAKVFVTENVSKGVRPRLEFPVLDYLAPKDKLEVPRAILCGPGHGKTHRSEVIYRDEDPEIIVEDFVRRCPVPDEMRPGIVEEVLRLLKQRCRHEHVFIVGLVAPPERQGEEDDMCESDSEDDDEHDALVTPLPKSHRDRLVKIAQYKY